MDREQQLKNLIVLVGPTSSGKTSISLELAKECTGELISADSRQVCKYMDIGTGKVPILNTDEISKYDNKWLINNIPVWGYDLTDPNEYFTAYDFAQYARNKINEILDENKNAFLVGGTGFYIDIVTGKKELSKKKPDLKIREKLEKLDTPELQNKLKKLDLEKYEKIDIQNRIRLIRAIEIVQTKEVNESLPQIHNLKYHFLGLTAEREYLYKRVDFWLDSIWNSRFFDEVNFLLANFPDSVKLEGLVYKSAVAFVKKELDEEEAKQRAKYDLHAYIRRQQTWFKSNKDIKWFDIQNPEFKENIKNYVSLILKC